jgi:uncharacterized membrane protein
MGASKVLGILSLCLGWLIPIVGAILAIIGLSIKKQKGKEDRDKNLNTIGLIVSIIAWLFYWIVFWA